MRLTENIEEVIYDGTNFRAFKLSIKSKLKKKAIGYVLENIKLDDDKYRLDDEKAFGLITEKMTLRQADAAQKFENCKSLWDHLTSLNESKSDEFLIIKRQELYKVRCGEKDNIKDHISDLEYYQSILKDTSAPAKDSELVVILMGSLPESWQTFLASFRGKGISGNWEKLVTAIYAEEIARKSTNVEQNNSGDEKVLNVKRELKCFKCNKLGHMARKCKSKIKCYTCGNTGHISKMCKENKQANTVCGNKFELLYDCDTIIDSGASSHMVNQKDLFETFTSKRARIFL
jgi:hypothetical protein